MTLHVWLPKGIEKEYPITVSGEFKTLEAFPFKWFSVEVENDGPDEVKVMINDESLPDARTLDDKEAREFDYKHPAIYQVRLYNENGKTANCRVITRR